MTQNHLTARPAKSFAPLARVKDNLREETERSLCDIAYVLHLAGRVKLAMLEEKSPVVAQ